MAILILSKLSVQFVLLFHKHTDHLIVENHILRNILLLVENFDCLLEKLSLNKELLHLLQIVKLNSCKNFPLSNLYLIVICLMFERLHESQRSIGNFEVIFELLV